MNRTATACLALALTGCTYRVVLASSPPGAVIYVDEEIVGVTPLPVAVSHRGKPPSIRVELTGYRSFELDMTRDLRLRERIRYNLRHPWLYVGDRSPPTRTVVLIPNHGPAGTWTPEDVER